MITKEDEGRGVTHDLYGYATIVHVDADLPLVQIYVPGMEYDKEAQFVWVHPVSLTLVPEMTEEELDAAMSSEAHEPNPPMDEGYRYFSGNTGISEGP